MVSGQSIEISVIPPVAIDGSVGGEWRSPLDQQREEIITWVVNLLGVEEVVRAKEEFFAQTGMIFHDDESYHRRMSYFIDYFLFIRPLTQLDPVQPPTPFALYRDKHPGTAIHSFTHSLFKVIKIQNSGLALKDLCSDDKIRIQKQSDELFDGIAKSDVFQGFVFHMEDTPVLSHGLIFHPARSHRLLVKALKEAKKQGRFERLSYLAHCARLQLKHARLRHVDPRLVYAEVRS
ncbi:hypothetical protein [Oligoflexus tunisiensis]|uniref:hypothetical protein n=1 Tax=Oligoflexus tunisiensis TaxID=708132 RepID=UPI00114C93EE|nr:hypothetical protein [Oligoflexus tunisiensis]